MILFSVEEAQEDNDNNTSNTNNNNSISDNIKPKMILWDTLWKLKLMITNKNFLRFISLTLISKIGDVFYNEIIDLVYLENGMSETFYANVETLTSLIRIGFAYYFSSIKSNFLSLFINSYQKIILLYIGELLLLLYRLYSKSNNNIINEIVFYTFYLAFSLIKIYLCDLSFATMNGFFNKIADIQIGATYLTALCSANNLSEKWPGFFVFYFVDKIGFKLTGILSIIYRILFYNLTKKSYHELDLKDENEWKLNLQKESKNKTE